MMKKLIILTVLVCGIVSAQAATIYSDSFTMTEISYNASNQVANDINNAGQITGTSWNGYYAYMRNANGDFSYLYAQTAPGVGTHGRTYGNAISANGNVITTGSGTITSLNYQPLVYPSTAIVPPAAGYNPVVLGVSTDRGNAVSSQYVGGYHTATKKQAVIWDSATGTQVSTYGDIYQNRWYTDVSANNIFVGVVENAGSIITKYDSGTSAWVTTAYEDPGYGSITQFNSVNGDGTLFCGYIRNTSSGTYYSANVWSYIDGTITRVANLALSDAASTVTKATAISSNGQLIVGIASNVAVVWENLNGTWTKYNFTDLLPEDQQSLWTGITLTGINDSGSIVGYGTYNGQAYTSGFVLAVPEPATMALLAIGTSILFIRKKK